MKYIPLKSIINYCINTEKNGIFEDEFNKIPDDYCTQWHIDSGRWSETKCYRGLKYDDSDIINIDSIINEIDEAIAIESDYALISCYKWFLSLLKQKGGK